MPLVKILDMSNKYYTHISLFCWSKISWPCIRILFLAWYWCKLQRTLFCFSRLYVPHSHYMAPHFHGCLQGPKYGSRGIQHPLPEEKWCKIYWMYDSMRSMKCEIAGSFHCLSDYLYWTNIFLPYLINTCTVWWSLHGSCNIHSIVNVYKIILMKMMNVFV